MERTCWEFGRSAHAEEVERVSEVNTQVTRVIAILGRTGAGHRAIIKGILELQGIIDEEQLERLYEGKSDEAQSYQIHDESVE